MTLKRNRVAALVLAALCTPAHGFEAVDTAPYTSSGIFPGYEGRGEDPRAFYAQAGIYWDDNVLRRSTDERSELITRLGLGVRNDLRVVGRQVLRLQADANLFAYRNFSELDHIGYTGLAEWRWELGNDLGGTLGYTRGSRQADPAEVQAPVIDRITEDRLYGSGIYRVGPNLRLRGGADWASARRPRLTDSDTETTGWVAGADWVSALGNMVGLEYRHASGDALVELATVPVTYQRTDFERREVAALLGYAIGTQWRLSARVGHTDNTYAQLPNRDFSGITWRVGLDWAATAKTVVSAETYRGPRAAVDFGTSHVIVTGFSVGPSVALTAKTSVFARFLRENRDYQGQGTVGDPLREETAHRYVVGAGWEITRQTRLGVAWEHGTRDSNLPLREYTYNAAMLNLRYDF